jgi:O-antigen ligase
MASFPRRRAASVIFAISILAAPLLFGAVDRIFQIGLALLLGAGIFCMPPQLPGLGKKTKGVLIGCLLLLVLKDFAPAFLFGSTEARTLFTKSLGLDLPFTHHPEPARPLDLLLVLAIGALWFWWAATLAADRKERLVMAWSIFLSAAAVAAVSLLLPPNPNGIYGIRPSPGWTGFGPFPNRNHTAAFLAMGGLIGCGLITRAARRKYLWQVGAGVLLLALVAVAIFQSKSRGGLLAFAVGLMIYAALSLFKLRSRAALIAVVSGGVLAMALFLAFGSSVLARFQSANEGDIPTNVRWSIWENTLEMWKDAPLFGHGLGSFAHVFPAYQKLPLANQVVLHPESSWLQWLTEIGLLPLLVLVALAAWMILRNLRGSFQSTGFFLRASAFAAVALLLVHSCWDVPAHRWGTVWLGAAALALACPLRSGGGSRRSLAWVPLLIAAFWSAPFFFPWPAWSPTTAANVVALNNTTMRVPIRQMEKTLVHFPLDPNLHQALGLRKVSDANTMQEAWEHFRAADRLRPASWVMPVAQALASKRYSSGMTLHYWTLAIERAGHRNEEIFQMAMRETEGLPAAETFWSGYAETNRQYLLSYALNAEPEAGRSYFQLWWDERGQKDPVENQEADYFYLYLPKWGTLEQLNHWIQHRPEREARDYSKWAALLHHFGEDQRAWNLLSRRIKEPEFPANRSVMEPSMLQARLREEPGNWLHAQALAHHWMQDGAESRAKDLIKSVAARKDAPVWFRHKSAYLAAAEGDYKTAVANLLK